MKQRTPSTFKRGERGSSLVEFVLCFVLFWVPLFMGCFQIGFNLIREIEVTQVCRDAGHLYSQKKDFTQSVYQQLLAGLAPGSFNISATGNTAFYFTTIIYVDDAACTNGGLLPNVASCPNYHQNVMTQQVPLGAVSLRASSFGTPSSTICKSSNSYVIAQSDYLRDSSAIAKNVPITLTASNQWIYATETLVQSTDYSFWSGFGVNMDYAQSFF